MKLRNIKTIIAREYLTRVKKKSFLLITFLGPIFFAAIAVLPSIIMFMAEDKGKQVAVIDDVAEEFGICPEFVMAVCEYESGGNQNCTNNLGCTGLMQIYPKYNQERMRKYGVTNLRDPRQNVTIGCDLLAELFDKYEDSALVLMKYHGENKAQQKYEEGQMSSYAKKILVRSEELERMRGK